MVAHRSYKQVCLKHGKVVHNLGAQDAVATVGSTCQSSRANCTQPVAEGHQLDPFKGQS